ncbi:MAG: nuclear transport factor 2 family protein [Alphaproteobacteria bacterium]|nr:nuclear transport factor 2 family protein [Alphaproteobacteria bacterium]
MTRDAVAALITEYLHALERKDVAALDACLHPEVEQVEHPNALVRQGARRDRAGLLEGLRRGAQVLRAERYAVHHLLVDGDHVAARVRWTGTLAIPVLGRAAGEDLTAEFGVFFELAEGRVRRQWNFDCFEL